MGASKLLCTSDSGVMRGTDRQTVSVKYFQSGTSGHGVLVLKHICGQVTLLLHKELCVLWGMSVQALGPLIIPLLSVLK